MFRLVAYDLRGHGASDKPLAAENYTSSDLWAEDLPAVIRGKDLDRPVLVGWSYGGYVMADYVRRFGQDGIGGLVFVGAATNAVVPPEVRLAMFSRQLDNDDVLAGIEIPTLVVHGGDDRIVRVTSAEHIAETVPDARLLVYEGAGHAAFLDDAERFDRDLAGFVRSTREDGP